MINYRKAAAGILCPWFFGVCIIAATPDVEAKVASASTASAGVRAASVSSAARASSASRSSSVRSATRSTIRSQRSPTSNLSSSNTTSSAFPGVATGALVGALAASSMPAVADVIDDVADIAEVVSSGSADNAAPVASLSNMSDEDLLKLAAREHKLMGFIKQGYVICSGRDRPRSTGCDVDVAGGFKTEYQRFTWVQYVERVTGIKDANIVGLSHEAESGRTVIYFSYVGK